MAATALGSAAITFAPAMADTTTTQISSIEKQIHALEGQLNHMKHDLSARGEEVKAARTEAGARAMRSFTRHVTHQAALISTSTGRCSARNAARRVAE